MNLVSLDDLDAERIRDVLAGRGPRPEPRPRLLGLLDFLPLGAEGLALRAAARSLDLEVLEAGRVLPGFPGDVDFLDAVEALGAYCDLLVVRHPLRGAARAAVERSAAPVVNAGDGTGEDPLFALADLARLSRRLEGLSGMNVALCGDLLRNRRAHSLAGGLVAAGSRVLLVPAQGTEPDGGTLLRLARARGFHPVRFEARSMSTLLDMVDSWLLTPDLDHQLSLLPDLVASSDRERRLVRDQVRDVQAMWVGSPRDDRGEPGEEPRRGGLPWRAEDGRAYVSPTAPRDEPPDWAGRAPAEIRALTNALALVLAGPPGEDRWSDRTYHAEEGVRCHERGCIACREPARVRPAFLITRMDPVVLTCVYCFSTVRAQYVGSRLERRYHLVTSTQVTKIRPENTVFFADREQAEEAGFVPSKI